MLKKWVKVLLFFNSYTPLWTILLIKISFQNNVNVQLLWIGIIVLIFIIFVLPLLIKISKSIGNLRILTIKEKQDISHAYLEYIITYIIPFIQQNYKTTEDAISILILMLVIMYVYISSNMIYVNPMLKLIGYNLFKVYDEYGNMYLLLTKEKDVLKNFKIKAVEFSENVVIEVSRYGD